MAARFLLRRTLATQAAVAPSAAVPGREALLYTPGPLTTSAGVKQAMQVDLGSRDSKFLDCVEGVRNDLLEMAHTASPQHECVLMQGSGTFAVESVISSVVPDSGKLLILANGAYGERIGKMCEVHRIPYDILRYGERGAPNAADAAAAVEADPSITHVATIHHETTSGALNPVQEIGDAIKAVRPELTYIVDSMSAFGCYDIGLGEGKDGQSVDYLVSSSNKCIEGVPGFAFAIAKRDKLLETEGVARTLSLDLLAQWQGLEKDGQFRFTPPTHALLAFQAAMDEHKAEGGVAGRRARYEHNAKILVDGMAEMGFKPYLDDAIQGCVITTFLFPDDANFDFPIFYKKLQDRGLVIYPGKLTDADCFRLGSIGRLFERDMVGVLAAVRDILSREMGVQLPVTQIAVEDSVPEAQAA
jgi:2-aminoethylphosphonate-pyruvate transaminase